MSFSSHSDHSTHFNLNYRSRTQMKNDFMISNSINSTDAYLAPFLDPRNFPQNGGCKSIHAEISYANIWYRHKRPLLWQLLSPKPHLLPAISYRAMGLSTQYAVSNLLCSTNLQFLQLKFTILLIVWRLPVLLAQYFQICHPLLSILHLSVLRNGGA